MTAEYSPSPSTDDEYSEVKGEGRQLQIHEISDSDPEDSGGKLNKSSLKTDNDIEVLNHLPKRTVPNSNVPERIIFCIDTCQVADSSLFVLDHGTSFTPINMLKRITEFFLYSKQSINHNTEFALVLLKESEVVWQHHFTKNIVEIIMHLDKFEGEECNAEEFDLTKLFDLINTKVSLPEICLDYKIVPPANVIRLILLYNRSNCLPKLLSGTRSFDMIKEHPYFTIDILYSHEDKCSGHKCLEIYDALQSLDNGYSYIFEVVKCAAKMHECAAKLLAHPLQRPLQKNSSYSFTSDK